MTLLVNNVMRWKYILSGLILCWLLVGLPYVTLLSTWAFIALIALGSYKIVKMKCRSDYVSLPVALILTILIAVNTRWLAIYQDISFEPDIWISQKYRPSNGEHLNVVSENRNFIFLRRPYDFPQYNPKLNHILANHYIREVRLNTPIYIAYPSSVGDDPRANKIFLHLTSNEENAATIDIAEAEKRGVHQLTYSLYDKDKNKISSATFQYRQKFYFEKVFTPWPSGTLDDKNVSSLSYLLHRNPISTYITSFVPEQNQRPLERFLHIAL